MRCELALGRGVADGSDPNRVLVVRFEGQELLVGPGGRLELGRSPASDFVLNDAKVSRHHATILWPPEDSHPWLRDNESTNGVEVGGNPINGRYPLLGSCEMTIGPFALALEFQEMTPAPSESSRIEIPEHGDMQSNTEIIHFLLNLEDAKWTGVMHLDHFDETKYTLTFRKGLVINAVGTDVAGDDALYRIVTLPEAEHRQGSVDEQRHATMNVSIRKYLFEFGLGDTTHSDED